MSQVTLPFLAVLKYRHDRFDYRHPQREDVQPSGNQTRDDRTLSRRVLVDVQTRETWKAGYRSHTFLTVHSSQVNNNNNNHNNNNNNNNNNNSNNSNNNNNNNNNN